MRRAVLCRFCVRQGQFRGQSRLVGWEFREFPGCFYCRPTIFTQFVRFPRRDLFAIVELRYLMRRLLNPLSTNFIVNAAST
jgi:hypothetical protein